MLHVIKMRWLKRFRRSHSLHTLIETGTWQGATVEAMRDQFEQIYTIELDQELWEQATVRFSQYSHVHTVHGDSGEVLASILPKISARCLFWLDGHFSGSDTAHGKSNTPIVKELAAIQAHHIKDHVILVDDVRCYNGTDGYPTLESIFSMLRGINPDYTIKVADDIVQAYP